MGSGEHDIDDDNVSDANKQDGVDVSSGQQQIMVHANDNDGGAYEHVAENIEIVNHDVIDAPQDMPTDHHSKENPAVAADDQQHEETTNGNNAAKNNNEEDEEEFPVPEAEVAEVVAQEDIYNMEVVEGVQQQQQQQQQVVQAHDINAAAAKKAATVPLPQVGAAAAAADGQIYAVEDRETVTITSALLANCKPETDLEKKLFEALEKQVQLSQRLGREIGKLKTFISKRKQTYKRKRKEEGAPTRALSAYNIFVQERFSRLARENEEALKSADSTHQLKRVPPASLVASTGNAWKDLPLEEKAYYQEKAANDKRRYEEQMAAYNPPNKGMSKKRNKTGYNMFFSAHVMQLKQTSQGVPSERGAVARIVGNAWKKLTPEQKDYYEQEAMRQNRMDSGEGDQDKDGMPMMPHHPGVHPHQAFAAAGDQRFNNAQFQHPGFQGGTERGMAFGQHPGHAGQQYSGQQHPHFGMHPHFPQGAFGHHPQGPV